MLVRFAGLLSPAYSECRAVFFVFVLRERSDSTVSEKIRGVCVCICTIKRFLYIYGHDGCILSGVYAHGLSLLSVFCFALFCFVFVYVFVAVCRCCRVVLARRVLCECM